MALLRKYITGFLAILLVIVTFLTFQPVLNADFVNWDDPTLLTNNPLVQDLTWDNVGLIFKTTAFRIYCPLTILSFALEHHIFGLDPFIYHANNLLLHILNVLLIFIFCQRMRMAIPAAFFSALLFAIHPMHVESVAWVTERKDVLYVFFYLLALNQYLRYLNTHKKTALAITWICGCLSLLAKPMAISLPLILLLIDWWEKREGGWRLIAEKSVFLIYMIPIALMTLMQFKHSFPIEPSNDFLKISYITVFYLRKFLIPDIFGMFYALPEPVSIMNPLYLGSVIILFVLILAFFRIKNLRLFQFALLYYGLSIFFTLRRVQINSPQGEPFYSFEDRFMYLPSLGICMLIGWILYWVYTHKSYFFKISVMLIFFSLSLHTYAQCNVWQSSLNLWNQVIRVNPHCATAYNNRATVITDYDQKIRDYTYALKLDPHFIEAYINRGKVFAILGQTQLAICDFDAAIRLVPQEASAYYARAQTLIQENRFEEAKKDLETARKLGFPVD